MRNCSSRLKESPVAVHFCGGMGRRLSIVDGQDQSGIGKAEKKRWSQFGGRQNAWDILCKKPACDGLELNYILVHRDRYALPFPVDIAESIHSQIRKPTKKEIQKKIQKQTAHGICRADIAAILPEWYMPGNWWKEAMPSSAVGSSSGKSVQRGIGFWNLGQHMAVQE